MQGDLFTHAATFNGIPWDVEDHEDYSKSSRCSECKRLTKTYRRKLTSTMARLLIRLYSRHRMFPEVKFFHRTEFKDNLCADGDLGLLQFWRLVEEMPNDGTAKRTSGKWRLTGEGEAFVTNAVRVPKYVVVRWNSTRVKFSGAAVTIREALEYGNRWKYDDLMGGV